MALGDVFPKDVQGGRDAWTEHFRLIGKGTGPVEDRVWLIFHLILPWMLIGGRPCPPGAEVVWPDEWCVGLVVPLWKRKGTKKDKNTWRVFCR